MPEKNSKYLLFICLILLNVSLGMSQEKKAIDYHFVYIALCQDDNTDYQKLILELKKLNSELQEKKHDCVLYFTKGLTRYSTNNLKEWGNLYPLINGSNITNLYASVEIENALNLFKDNEFSMLKNNRLTTNSYNNVTWHNYIGNGFFQADYNRSIIGVLIASCGINDKFGTNFQLNICHDTNDPIVNFKAANALGKYYSFITDENTKLKEY